MFRMPRRRWRLLIGVCLLVSPIGFAVGRWSRAVPANVAALPDALLEVLAREATSNGKALLGVLEKSNLPPSQKAYLAGLIPPEKSFAAAEDSEGN